MQFVDYLQLGLFLLIIILFTKPLGLYLSKVLNPNERTFFDPAFKPLERWIYKACRIDPLIEQSWKSYLASVWKGLIKQPFFCKFDLFLLFSLLF